MTVLSRLFSRSVAWVVLVGFLIFTIAPYAWLVITSLKTEAGAVHLPVNLLPQPPTTESYRDVLNGGGSSLGISTTPALRNTIIVSLSSTVLALILGLPAAYSFAKYRFPMGRWLLLGILVTRMFPVVALAIPLFQIVRAVGLYDSRIGLTISYTALTLPFVIWVMYAFFVDIPPSLEEAARLDGCNFFQMFTRVILPVARPGIAAAFLLSLVYPWNDLLLSSILTASSKSQTLPAALAQYNTGTQLYWSHLSAASVVATVPILILTVLLQRYIVQGLTLGSVRE
jgi:multiple sugar transport system permease protein